MQPIVWNFSLGAVVAAYGTLVGAGGGFLLVPLFLLFYKMPHELAVGTSLAIVTMNAFSGTLGYVKDKKIDYRAGILFALFTFPGAVAGAYSVDLVSGPVFQRVFGICLFCAAFHLLFLRKDRRESYPGKSGWGWVKRTTHGETYSYFEPLGLAFSAVVGVISSWLGIGGGIVHVPLMTEVLRFPVQIAVATSHFILGFTALVGAAVHASRGHVDFSIALPAGIGAVLGAQVGVRISRAAKGSAVLKALSVALLAVGLRLLWG